MRDGPKRLRRILLIAVVMTAVRGCGGGGGSGDSTPSGGMTFNVRWQQQPVATSQAATDATCTSTAGSLGSAGFGTPIPAAAETIRMLYVADEDTCCVAFHREDLAALQERRVVFKLREAGEITVSAYAT